MRRRVEGTKLPLYPPEPFCRDFSHLYICNMKPMKKHAGPQEEFHWGPSWPACYGSSYSSCWCGRKRPLQSGPSPHFSHPLYCIGAMIRPDCATRKAGAPSVGLLNVPYSTFAGASVARGATHSGRPFRRFVTSRCEKCGLAGCRDSHHHPLSLILGTLLLL